MKLHCLVLGASALWLTGCRTPLEKLVAELVPEATLLSPPRNVSLVGLDSRDNRVLKDVADDGAASYDKTTLTYSSTSRFAIDFSWLLKGSQLKTKLDSYTGDVGRVILTNVRVREILGEPIPIITSQQLTGLRNGTLDELHLTVVNKELTCGKLEFVGGAFFDLGADIKAEVESANLAASLNAQSNSVVVSTGTASTRITLASETRPLVVRRIARTGPAGITDGPSLSLDNGAISLRLTQIDGSKYRISWNTVDGTHGGPEDGIFGSTFHRIQEAAGRVTAVRVEQRTSGSYRYFVSDYSCEWQ